MFPYRAKARLSYHYFIAYPLVTNFQEQIGKCKIPYNNSTQVVLGLWLEGQHTGSLEQSTSRRMSPKNKLNIFQAKTLWNVHTTCIKISITFDTSIGMFIELVANPIPNVTAASTPKKSATSFSSRWWISSVPITQQSMQCHAYKIVRSCQQKNFWQNLPIIYHSGTF